MLFEWFFFRMVVGYVNNELWFWINNMHGRLSIVILLCFYCCWPLFFVSIQEIKSIWEWDKRERKKNAWEEERTRKVGFIFRYKLCIKCCSENRYVEYTSESNADPFFFHLPAWSGMKNNRLITVDIGQSYRPICLFTSIFLNTKKELQHFFF